jgi:hypothetical protein
MGAHWSRSMKKERTSKMRDTNRGGLDRQSDNDGSKVATERIPAISGLTGSTRNFLTVVRGTLC